MLLVLLLAGCGPSTGVVEVSGVPALDDSEAQACHSLVQALPETLDGQPRRPVRAPDGAAAAWGDPPIVLTCGGTMPRSFDRFSRCQWVEGVGWYVPPSAFRDPTSDPTADEPVTLTTIGYGTVVQVRLPATYRPPAAAMVELAPVIKGHLTLQQPCR